MPDGSQFCPYVDPDDAEGAALVILRLIDRHLARINHPFTLSSSFGLDLRCGRVPGLVACLDTRRRRATLRGGRDDSDTRWHWDLAHELGHYVADVLGWPRPHDESMIDVLAGRLWIRRAAVMQAVGSVGWSAMALVRYFGTAPASVVFRRVTEEARGVAIGRDGFGRRFAFGPEGWPLSSSPTRWERHHLRIAMAGGVEPFLKRGGEVSPFEDPATETRGAVILYPAEPEFLRG